jgi:guanine deaminase
MIIIHGGRVLRPGTFDCAPLDVIVERDTIMDLVAPGSVGSEAAQRIDAADKLLIPGLVNGHTHAQVTLGKGMFDRYTLELYLNAMAFGSGRRTLEDKYVSAALGATEMVRKGCTAAYDMFAEFPLPTVEGVDAVARAYSDVGMRAVIAPMLADRSFYRAIPGLTDVLPDELREAVLKIEYAPHAQTVAACRTILEGWRWDRAYLRPALGPTIPHHCSDEFLVECRDLASELDVGIQMHVAESKLQAVVAQRRYGRSLVAHLDELGLLGPRFCAAHGIWIDADDRSHLADAGASIAHNPGSNFKLGSGMADLRRMLDSGINVALGTDGCASSDNLNLFEAMRLASFVSRVGDHPVQRWIESREALHAVTEGGARALSFEGIGRIASGYKADIVFIDLAASHFVPFNNAANQLVFGEDGTGVESVMIGGRMVLDHGRFTTIDPAKLRLQAEAAVARLAAETREGRALSERLAPLIGQYCSGLAAAPHPVHRFWNG